MHQSFIVHPPATTIWPLTPFGLTITLRQLYTCRRTTIKIRNSRLSNARDLYLVMSLDSWLLTWTPLGTTLWTKPNLNFSFSFSTILPFPSKRLAHLFSGLGFEELSSTTLSWIRCIDLTISIGICGISWFSKFCRSTLRKSSGFHLCRWLIEAYFN